MNIFLWAVQILLALHTLVGAIWKFSHTAEQTMPSLKAIPKGIWLGMSAAEVVISVLLILPAFYRPMAILIPVAAICIAAEMLLFCGLHIGAGQTYAGPLIYWLVVATVCAFVAYGRWVLAPL